MKSCGLLFERVSQSITTDNFTASIPGTTITGVQFPSENNFSCSFVDKSYESLLFIQIPYFSPGRVSDIYSSSSFISFSLLLNIKES